jgi:hypothetical protein
MRRNSDIPIKNSHFGRIASEHKLVPKKYLKTTAMVGTGILVIPIIGLILASMIATFGVWTIYVFHKLGPYIMIPSDIIIEKLVIELAKKE